MKKDQSKEKDRNPDPISGEPGSHPMGVGTGATGGAVAGAAVGGAVAGPVGAVVGGAVGAVAGGLAGKGAAELVNPTEEERYWRTEYRKRPYVKSDRDYEYYGPAFQYGWESASKPTTSGRSFEDIEPELERDWGSYRGTSKSDWREVREATRDAYARARQRR